MEAENVKRYTDKSTQTSPVLSPRALTKSCKVWQPAIGTSLLQDATTTGEEALRVIKYVSLLGKSGLPASQNVILGTPVKCTKPRIPYAQPSLLPNGTISLKVQEKRRIVSLPEKLEAETASELAQSLVTNSRSISMPAAFRHFASLGLTEDDMSMHYTSSFTTDEEENIRALGSPASPDLPHTPSPPSTPESVEIIEERNRLPDSFLQKKAYSGSLSINTDDGQ